ncbi:hypothetical protein Plhal304r1_c008g0031251 [Plasmopara halstedii]
MFCEGAFLSRGLNGNTVLRWIRQGELGVSSIKSVETAKEGFELGPSNQISAGLRETNVISFKRRLGAL